MWYYTVFITIYGHDVTQCGTIQRRFKEREKKNEQNQRSLGPKVTHSLSTRKKKRVFHSILLRVYYVLHNRATRFRHHSIVLGGLREPAEELRGSRNFRHGAPGVCVAASPGYRGPYEGHSLLQGYKGGKNSINWR